MRYFENTYDLAEEAIERLLEIDDDIGSVSIVACGDACADIVKDLFFISSMEDMELSVAAFDLDRYEEGPYILSITTDFEIWVQRGITPDGHYIMLDDDVAYVTPEYYDGFKKALADEEFTEMIPFDFGEDTGVDGLIKNDEGQVCGFTYDDDRDGRCCHVMFCWCEPQDMGKIADAYNFVMEAIGKINI